MFALSYLHTNIDDYIYRNFPISMILLSSKVAEANKTSDSVQEEVLLKELSTIEDADEINVSIRSILDYPKFRFRALLLLLVS